MTQIKITQADRDRAGDWLDAEGLSSETHVQNIRDGLCDENTLVQAFAAHRVEAEQQMMGCFREMLTALAESCTLETIEEQGAPA